MNWNDFQTCHLETKRRPCSLCGILQCEPLCEDVLTGLLRIMGYMPDKEVKLQHCNIMRIARVCLLTLLLVANWPAFS